MKGTQIYLTRIHSQGASKRVCWQDVMVLTKEGEDLAEETEGPVKKGRQAPAGKVKGGPRMTAVLQRDGAQAGGQGA